MEGRATADHRHPQRCEAVQNKKNAEDFFASVVTLGQPPLPNPTTSIFTDGSAFMTSVTAGWGLHIQPREPGPVEHCVRLTTWQRSLLFFTLCNGLYPLRPTLPPKGL